MYLSLIKRQFGDDENAMQPFFVKEIEACVMGLQRNIERLLPGNVPELSLVAKASSSQNLAELLLELNLAFVEVAAEAGVRLKVRIDNLKGVKVASDPDLLAGIISNLISNGIKFRKPDMSDGVSWVLVACVRLDREIRIDVADNGIGIEKMHQEVIFSPGVRVAGNLQLNARGHGLGLASAMASLSELRGHRIFLKSRPNIGSRFSIYIPR